MGDAHPSPSPPADRQDLINAVLHTALTVSYAIDQLHTLSAAAAAADEPAAVVSIKDAITVMDAACRHLIANADRLLDNPDWP